MKNKEYFNLELPKWPGVLVIGDPITKEQAAEILIRTDDFTFSANDRDFEKLLNKEVYGIEETTSNLFDAINEQVLGIGKDDPRDWNKAFDYQDMKRAEAGKLPLNYMSNEQIISCWIGGPHGWCDWEGNIGCKNYNIGKYPTVKEDYDDWVVIAKEFPFLNLRCQLLNHEISCEEYVDNPGPVVEFIVKKGKVKVMITCLEKL